MRYRINTYDVNKTEDSVRLLIKAPEDATIEGIRLVIDESKTLPLVSSMQKGNATLESGVTGGDFTHAIIIPSGIVDEVGLKLGMASAFTFVEESDEFTIEVDWGDKLEDVIDLIGDLNEILEAINGDTVDGIVADYLEEHPITP
jgi:hypothetical protein